MKKTISLLAAGLMLICTVGLANATTMTNDLNDVIAAGGVGVSIPGVSSVSSLIDPFGGIITFSSPMQHRVVGSSWTTWSSTYGDPTGLDVLYTGSGVTSITMSFAPDTVKDFGFELEPNPFATLFFTLGLQDGSALTQMVNGDGGALAFGFTGGDVEWLAIFGQSDFAIGRLIMDSAPIPEPSTILLLAGGLAGLALLKRRQKA